MILKYVIKFVHLIFVQDKVDESMLIKFRRQHVSNWYRFTNGRREGANPSSHVIVPPNLEFLNQYLRPINLCLN